MGEVGEREGLVGLGVSMQASGGAGAEEMNGCLLYCLGPGWSWSLLFMLPLSWGEREAPELQEVGRVECGQVRAGLP